jgi:hypothetical protein
MARVETKVRMKVTIRVGDSSLRNVEGPYHVKGSRTRTCVSGIVRRNHAPCLKVDTRWECISYIYPRAVRATGSRSTSSTIWVVEAKTPSEYKVRMYPLSCPPRGSHNKCTKYSWYSELLSTRYAFHEGSVRLWHASLFLGLMPVGIFLLIFLLDWRFSLRLIVWIL